MPLTGVHILLSYQCTHECDHCFVWSSPRAGGTMSLGLLLDVLDQARDVGTVTGICFEGGEPFLFYPLLVEGVRQAALRGFSTDVVTNCYWATAAPDAALWLAPLRDLELGRLSVSNDAFHAGEDDDPRPTFAVEAARDVGLGESVITIEPPTVCRSPDTRGMPILGGSARFRGRAAATLISGLPRRPWDELVECPDEDFLDPARVHVDGFGNVHLCQGLLLGCLRTTPLRQLVDGYDPGRHPIIGPLVDGGPAELVRRFDLPHEDGYVDACHLCYQARSALRDRHAEALGPPEVYGLGEA